VAILAQLLSADFALTYNFQGTHILGASRGPLCNSKALLLCFYLADEECTSGRVLCGGSSPRRSCVSLFGLCNGRNYCGNNWDEDPETCGQFAFFDRFIDFY